MKAARKPVYLLLGVLFLANTAPAQEASLASKLQSKLESLYQATTLPGVSAAVILADGTVIPLTAGWSDRDAKKPMSADALLMQGSVGKTYVAAVALQLIHEGKLALDEKVEKHLGKEPWFERLPNAQDISVKMLLNHTSGLVRYEFQQKFTDDLTKQPDKKWKPEEQVSYIFDTKAPFAAGKGWQYSDTNYIVLGMVIEKVTGKTFHEELRRRILEPHGLKQTTPVEGKRVPGLVQGHAGARNPFGGKDKMLDDQGDMIINPQFEWTGGGMASTPSDLVRWAKLMYEGKAFDSSLLPTMLEGVPATLGRDTKYGLGVILRPTPHGPTYGHSGFFPGYLTEMMYWPEHKIAIAVQVNTSELRNVRPPLTRWCTDLAGVVVGK